MANIRISDLPQALFLDGTEDVPIVQGGTTKRVTSQTIGDLGSGSTSGITALASVLTSTDGVNRVSVDATGVTAFDGWNDTVQMQITPASGNFPAAFIKSTLSGAEGPSIVTYADSSSPAVGDRIAQEWYYANHSGGSYAFYADRKIYLVNPQSSIKEAVFAYDTYVSNLFRTRVLIGAGILCGQGSAPGTPWASLPGADNIRAQGFVRTDAQTTVSLPSAATAGAGARAFVTDASTINFGSSYVGGGANARPVWSDGTDWYIG